MVPCKQRVSVLRLCSPPEFRRDYCSFMQIKRCYYSASQWSSDTSLTCKAQLRTILSIVNWLDRTNCYQDPKLLSSVGWDNGYIYQAYPPSNSQYTNIFMKSTGPLRSSFKSHQVRKRGYVIVRKMSTLIRQRENRTSENIHSALKAILFESVPFR